MPSDRFIELSDFRPGIHSDLHAVGSYTVATMDTTKSAIPVNGAATIDKTYRCCADPRSGGLIPLPRLIMTQSQTLLPNGNTNSGPTYYPYTGYVDAYLMDAVMTGPFYNANGNDQYTAEPFNTMALYQFRWDVNAGGLSQVFYVQGLMWERWKATPTIRHWIWSKQVTFGVVSSPGYPLISGSLDKIRTVDTVTPAAAITLSRHYVPVTVAGFGLVDASATFQVGATPANEKSVHTYDTDLTSGGNYTVSSPSQKSVLTCFPKPVDGPVATDVFSSVTDKLPYVKMVVAHQGRLVAIHAVEVTSYFYTTGMRQKKDILGYFPVLDFMATDAGGTWSQRQPAFLEVGEDNAAFIDTIGSLSADELFVVKSREGGYVVRGDMDSPTVQRLPYIESGGGICARGAITPAGYVYGSANGVFLWAGGEQTKKLSDQIEGFFWNHCTESYGNGYRGRFAYLHPWVAVPNNYFYDTRTESWWRIELPDATHIPFNVYEPWPANTPTGATLTNKLRCFPYKLTATRNEAFYDLDPALLASSYSWQSQPLFETGERVVAVRDISLTASIPGGPVGDAISLPGTVGNYASTPDATALDLTPNIEITCRVALADWTAAAAQCLVAKDDGVGQRSYGLTIDTAGILQFYTYSPGFLGNSATVPVPFIDGSAYWIRSVFTGNNGAGNRVIDFYYAPDAVAEPTVWTRLGTQVITAGASTSSNTTAELSIGSLGSSGALPANGKFHRMILRTVLGGSIQADFNADTATAGSATWVSATTGETWTKRGTALYVDAQTVTVTLTGYNPDGSAVTPVVTTFVLGQSSLNPQALLQDLKANFQAMHVQVQIEAASSGSAAAPKVNMVKIGLADRARVPRT